MANVKITELTAATALAGTDVLPIVDVGADATKKVSVSDLLRNLPDGTASAPALAFADDQNSGILSPAENELAFATSGTQRLVIDSSGNVGIGTSTLSNVLHVHQTDATANSYVHITQADGGSGATDGLSIGIEDGGVNAVIRNRENGYLRMYTNNSERMRIASNGRVGIGETSPDALLHLNFVSGNPQVILERSSSATAKYGLHAFSNAFTIKDEAQSQERLRIDSSGNVGIGTSSPSTNLDIVVASGTAKQKLGSSSVSGGSYTNYHGASGTKTWFVGSNFNVGGALEFFQSTTNGGTTPSSTPAMIIDSSGRVAIGGTTVTDSNLLNLQGSTASVNVGVVLNDTNASKIYGIQNISSGLNIFDYTAGSVRMRIDSSGNVGIGTSTPGRLLDVNGVIRSDGTSGRFELGGNSSTPSVGAAIHRPANNTLAFVTNSSERLRIDSSGRLLVGTSTGQGNSLLQVEGDSSSAAAQGSISLRRGLNTAAIGGNVGADLGKITFGGNDGTVAASIASQSDAAWSSTSDCPGRIQFSTTADGASSPTERMRIDSSGRVGIGETSMDGLLVIKGDSNASSMPSIRLKDGTDTREAWISNASGDLVLVNGGTDNTPHCKITMFDGNIITFETANSERMRITHDGDIHIGRTNNTRTTTGYSFETQFGVLGVTSNTNRAIDVNRQGNDGDLILFFQANSQEGSISVSGTTVSYNGAHLSRWSQLAGGAERTEILRGSVLSNLDEMCEWAYEAQDAVLYTEEDELPEGVSVGDVKTPARDAGTENNEQLNRMKVSDVEGDPNVAGVFQAWDDDDDTYTNDFYCAMTGDFVIRIAQGTTVARGDLLMSAGDGTAKPQDDDIVRSKTIAKVTSNTVSTTYADGSYCVPCVLMAC